MHTRLVVTQVYIENMFKKNKETGFQSAVFHLCQRALVPLLRMIEARMQRLLFRARETGKALLIT